MPAAKADLALPQGGVIPAFVDVALADPDRVFATFDGAPIRFGALLRQAQGLGAGLVAQGIGQGDVVAVMMRNSPRALAVVLGLGLAGVVWVPVNPGHVGPGLAHVLTHSGARLVIADHDLFATVAQAAPGLRILVNGGPADALGPALATEARPMTLPAPTDLCAIMYTSGTTGAPKGVLVTHRMMRIAAEGVRVVAGSRSGDVFFLWEPLYHIGGAQVLALPALAGITLAMTERFSASRFWQQVSDCRATHVHYLGGILQMLLKQPPHPAETTHCVRALWGGGCPAEVFAAARARWGIAIRECYGMTEMSSITTASDGSLGGVIGTALPWFRVTIRDASGPLAPGLRGEIVVETADPGAFFAEYLGNPDATARTLIDGRLHSGDQGSIDADGMIRFHGRLVDTLRVRGENVSAWEVEHVVTTHPDIEDCAVIGVTAEVGEQDILLYVQPRAGAMIDPAALSVWLTAQLPRWQNPRYIAQVAAFDRTPSQRIMKHRLPRDASQAWDRLASGET